MLKAWRDLFRSLGDSFLEVLSAEVVALRADLGQEGRRLGKSLALLAVALFILFWAVGIGVLVAYEILALFMARWLAALAAFIACVLLGLAVAGIARSRLRRLRVPTAIVKQHVQNHLDWLDEEVIAPQEGMRTSIGRGGTRSDARREAE